MGSVLPTLYIYIYICLRCPLFSLKSQNYLQFDAYQIIVKKSFHECINKAKP